MPIEFRMVPSLTTATGRESHSLNCYVSSHWSRLIAALDRANLLMWAPTATRQDREMHQLTYHMLFVDTVRKVWGL